MKRKDALNKYKWNVIELYPSDEIFLKDLNLYFELNKKLLRFEGKLNTAQNLIEFKKENELAEKINSKMTHFFKHLHVEQNNKRLNNLEKIYDNKLQYFDDKFTFIAEEIKKVGIDKIIKWCNENDFLKFYLKDYKEFFKNIKYLLPEEDRKIISSTSNSSSIIYEMYETLKYMDAEERKITYENKKYLINQNTLSDILQNSDPLIDQEKENFFSLEYRKKNKERMYTFTKIYEGIVKDEIESATIVGMKDFREYFFDNDYFEIKNFYNLISFVKNNSKIYYEYYQILKEHFGFSNKFYGTDTNLKLFTNLKISYSLEEAKLIIKNALNIFGQEYIKILDECLEDNKIDYFEDENKSSGAFTINSYNYNSLISMNYTDDLESISTLIHELGHSVHSEIVKKYQPKQYAGFDNMIAEVASTLNEHILFDYLIKNSDSDKYKINLLQQRIEFIFGNFFSAVSEAKFEYDIFDFLTKNDTLTVEIIEDISKKASKEILGDSIFDSIDKNSHKYGWINVSHFFEQPFYIYKYAVSIAISFKLYEKIKLGDINESLEFLKIGGSLLPKEIFEKFKFDLSNESFFVPLINEVNSMVNQLKILLKKQKAKL